MDTVWRQRIQHVVWFFVIMTVVVLYRGYSYGMSDHLTYLQSAYRIFDTSYLQNDWHLNAICGFGHRFFITVITAVLAQVFSLSGASFLLFLVSWFLIFHGTYRVAVQVSGRPFVGYIAAILVLVVLDPRLLCKIFYAGHYLPRDLARGLLLCGLAAWFGSRWVWGGILFGLATNVHVLTGGEAFGFAAVAILASSYRDSSSVKGVLKGIAAWAVVALPVTIPLVMKFGMGTSDSLSAHDWAIVTAWIRHPHHYVASTMPVSAYLLHISEIAAATLVWFRWRNREGNGNTAWNATACLMVVTLAAMIGYWFFSEVVLLPSVIKAEVLRNSYLLRISAAVILAAAIGKSVESLRDRSEVVPAIMVVVWVVAAGAAWGLGTVAGMSFWGYARIPARIWLPCSAVLLLFLADNRDRIPECHWLRRFVPVSLLILFVFALGLAVFQFLPLPGVITVESGLLGLTALGLVCYGLLYSRATEWLRRHVIAILAASASVFSLLFGVPSVAAGSGLLPHIAIAGSIPEPSEASLVEWVRTNTSEDAVFLTSPGPDVQWFRFRTDRAIVFNMKFYVFNADGTAEWLERLEDTGNVRIDLSTRSLPPLRYNELTTEQILELARKYGFSYVLRNSRTTPLNLPLVYENEGFRLYSVY